MMMNKLPLIEPKKKPTSSKTEKPTLPTKYQKGIYPIQNEDDKRKNNMLGNHYDIAINY